MTDRFAFCLEEWFSTNRTQVRRNLGRYFSGKVKDQFTGRWFESFAAVGDPNRFEPSDVLAVEALSVKVTTESAAKLLVTEADQFNQLERIPHDVDLWEVPRPVIESAMLLTACTRPWTICARWGG